jgi:site-specific DNA recombinase
MMVNAIGYVRVSTEEQAREGISLENQRAKIEAYCALHDLGLLEIVEDAGRSGKDLNRDGMQRVMELVRARSVDAVVVYKLDRLSRKVIDTLTLVDLMKKYNVAFHSITDAIDTKTAVGKFFLNIMASLAQMERDLISERTRDALQLKIEKKERAGQVPYGYRLRQDGRSLVECEEEQRAIAVIRALHGQGFTYRGICAKLQEAGHKPLGKRWHPKTIMGILRRAA